MAPRRRQARGLVYGENWPAGHVAAPPQCCRLQTPTGTGTDNVSNRQAYVACIAERTGNTRLSERLQPGPMIHQRLPSQREKRSGPMGPAHIRSPAAPGQHGRAEEQGGKPAWHRCGEAQHERHQEEARAHYCGHDRKTESRRGAARRSQIGRQLRAPTRARLGRAARGGWRSWPRAPAWWPAPCHFLSTARVEPARSAAAACPRERGPAGGPCDRGFASRRTRRQRHDRSNERLERGFGCRIR